MSRGDSVREDIPYQEHHDDYHGEQSKARIKSAAHTILSNDHQLSRSKDEAEERSGSHINRHDSLREEQSNYIEDHRYAGHDSRVQSASIDPIHKSYQSRGSKKASRADQIIIPVLDKQHKKQVIPEFLNDSEFKDVERNMGDDYMQAEDIDLTRLQFARMLSPFLSLGIVKGVFSKNWNYREQALNAIRTHITPEKQGDV